MDDDKSIVEKFTDAVKNVADTASTAVKNAMEPEPPKPDEEVVVVPAPDATSSPHGVTTDHDRCREEEAPQTCSEEASRKESGQEVTREGCQEI